MTRIVTATEAKARLLALLDDAANGDVIEITRHGRPVARLVPARGPRALRGKLAGAAMTVATAGVDDDHLFTTGATWDVTGAGRRPG